MVAREFQSYTSKRSVDFVNAVDVVDAAEEPKREKKRKISLPRRFFSCPRCRSRLGREWRRQKIRCGGGSRYATQRKLITKMPPPPRRGQDGACGREPLLDRMSWSWNRVSRCGAITSVRSPLPHSPGRRGTRCRPRRLEGGE